MALIDFPIGQSLNRCDCYTFTATITEQTGIPSSPIVIRIGDTDFATADPIGVVDATPGVYTFDFDFNATGQDYTTLFFSLSVIGELSFLINTSMTLQAVCADTFCSECYDLSDCGTANQCDFPQVVEKGLLIQWTNDENGLGFNYSQLGFIQQLRLEGGLRASSGSYDDETFYTTSGGQRGLVYTHTTKQEELWVQSIPEYLHDALRVALAHDHFFINGQEYVKTEGGYAPDWDVPNTLLAGVIVGVQKKTQDTFNINC